MQRIDKPTIYSVFWNAYPAGYLLSAICRTEGTEEKDSSEKASRIASFTSSRPSSPKDDEASSEFRPKIASVQNIVTLE
jgi:hypothetical protein